jgi:hypothetical protein
MQLKFHQRIKDRSDHPDIIALRHYVMMRIRDMQGVTL